MNCTILPVGNKRVIKTNINPWPPSLGVRKWIICLPVCSGGRECQKLEFRAEWWTTLKEESWGTVRETARTGNHVCKPR